MHGGWSAKYMNETGGERGGIHFLSLNEIVFVPRCLSEPPSEKDEATAAGRSLSPNIISGKIIE